MQGIIAMPNGMMAAFAGRELMFCEPYKPHAWPTKYRLTTETEIVGLAAFGSAVAVLTKGTPYLAQGSHPASMVMERLELNYPCLARRGIVDLGYAVAYPSTDGLVVLSTGGANVVTRPALTPAQWSALNPASFVAAQMSGRYLASWEDDVEDRSVIEIDLSGESPFITTSNLAPIALVNDIETGRVYAIMENTPDEVALWNGGDALTYRWQSGILRTDALVNFGALRIRADTTAAAVTAKVFADGALKATITTKNAAVRLPSGFLSSEWSLELSGAASVYAVTMAHSIEELGDG